MLISTITSNIPFIQLSLMHRITEKICKERWQHWCTKISGVKVLPTLLISTITSNMSFIQLSLMLSGYPASSSVWGAGIAPVDLTTLSSLRACRTLKTEVKRKFLTSPIDPLVTSCVSDAQNCGKTQISHFAARPFRHFGRVGRSKLW